MVISQQEAPLITDTITKEDVLRRIITLMINRGNYLFYKPHLKREYVLGTVGERGGGKSGSDAVIGIVDFMLRGKPVWSNMQISCDIEVNNEVAQRFGLNSGGAVHYESLPLEKDKLLKLDDTYRNGCLVIEEINVQFSNARRFMTNTNIESNELYQQLRKFETTLIYNVIDEMFVDSQLRELTDIFITTYDTAFDVDALEREKPPGLDFCWLVHSWSSYLNGYQGRYDKTKKADKCYFKFAPWRGVYNDKQHQEHGVYSLSKREREKLNLNVESSQEMQQELKKWAWLEDKVRFIRDKCIEDDMDYIKSGELAALIGVPLSQAIRQILAARYGISYDTYAQAYFVNKFKLETETASAART